MEPRNDSMQCRETSDHTKMVVDGLFSFPAKCLILGTLLDYVRERIQRRFFRLPSTVFLLLVTTIVTSLIKCFVDRTSLDDEFKLILGVETWIDVEPGDVMTLVLPVLIFDSSFHMDAHEFSTRMGAIMATAFLGFLLSSFILGLLMFMMMGSVTGVSEWGPGLCLLYGGVISATDPVAVVALLEELSAPLYVKVLIDGEALLNDGAAIILFHGLEAVLAHGHSLVVFPLLLANTLLSVLVGYIVARLTVYLCIHGFWDVQKEFGCVFFFVYGLYVACEEFGGSGVIGVVVMGLTMSSRREEMRHGTVETLHDFFNVFAYWANCVVFLLSGILVMRAIPFDSAHSQLVVLILGALAAFVFSILSRCLVFLIFGYAARQIQKRSSGGVRSMWPPGHLWMMCWGGLRGAVALLLAFKLKHAFKDKGLTEELDQIVLFTGTTVLLSLLIQASTYEHFANMVQLNKRSMPKQLRLKRLLRTCTKDFANTNVSRLKKVFHMHYDLADWTWVWNLVRYTFANENRFGKRDRDMPIAAMPDFHGNTSEDDISEPQTPLSELADVEEATVAEVAPALLSKAQLEELGKEEYVALLKRIVHSKWESGTLGRRTLRRLIHALETIQTESGEFRVDALTATSRGWTALDLVGGVAARFENFLRQHVPVFSDALPGQDAWRVTFCLALCGNFAAFIWDQGQGFADMQIVLLAHVLIGFATFLQTLFYGCRRRGRHVWRNPELQWWQPLKVEFVLDCLWLVVTVANFGLIYVSFKVWHCFQHYRDLDEPGQHDEKRLSWDDDLYECHVSRMILLGTTGMRAALGLPLSLMTLLGLIARELTRQRQQLEAAKVATLSAFIVITDNINTGSLFKTLPCLALRNQVAEVNIIARRQCYEVLHSSLKDAFHLALLRLAHTKQAALFLMNKIQKSVDDNRRVGLIASHQMDASKSQSECETFKRMLDEGMWAASNIAYQDVIHITASTFRAYIRQQIMRVEWVQHLPEHQFETILGRIINGLEPRHNAHDPPDPRPRPASKFPLECRLLKEDELDYTRNGIRVINYGDRIHRLYFLSEGLCLKIDKHVIPSIPEGVSAAEDATVEMNETVVPAKSSATTTTTTKTFIYPGSFMNQYDAVTCESVEAQELTKSAVRVVTLTACRIYCLEIKALCDLIREFPIIRVPSPDRPNAAARTCAIEMVVTKEELRAQAVDYLRCQTAFRTKTKEELRVWLSRRLVWIEAEGQLVGAERLGFVVILRGQVRADGQAGHVLFEEVAEPTSVDLSIKGPVFIAQDTPDEPAAFFLIDYLDYFSDGSGQPQNFMNTWMGNDASLAETTAVLINSNNLEQSQ